LSNSLKELVHVISHETFPHNSIPGYQEVPEVEEMLDRGRLNRQEAEKIRSGRVDKKGKGS